MSIKLVLTRGFGNGTFSASIKDVVTAGYGISTAVVSVGYHAIEVSIQNGHNGTITAQNGHTGVINSTS